MSRISNSLFSQTSAQFSSQQIHLDNLCSGFLTQASDVSSLAMFTLAGLAGQVARLGFLSTGAGRILSQVGSVAVEAASLTGFEQMSASPHRSLSQSTLHNTLQIGIFRMLSPLRFSNRLCQQALQSTGLVAAQRLSTYLPGGESASATLSEEFAQAFATNLALHSGNSLALFLSGGRLTRIQNHLERRATLPVGHRTSSAAVDAEIFSMSAEGRRSRKRVGTDLLDRSAQTKTPIELSNSSQVLTDLPAFAASLQQVVAQLSHFVERCPPSSVGIQDLHQQHARLIRSADWQRAFRNRLDEFAAAIRKAEGTPASTPPSPLPPAADLAFEIPVRSILPNWFRSLGRFFLNLLPARWRSRPAALPAPAPSVSAPELQTHREIYSRLYDQIILLQEATRIVANDHRSLSEADRELLLKVKSAYEALHENLQARREPLRRKTTLLVQADIELGIQRWIEEFSGNVRNLQIARNLQTLLGRVYLAQGEHMGGSFLGAFHEGLQSQRQFVHLKIIYDRETAQIVAFEDGSETSRKTIHNLRSRRRPLVSVSYVVDAEESGRIMAVDFEEAQVPDATQKVIRALLGLQVSPANLIVGFSDPNPSRATRYIVSTHTEWEVGGDLYKVIRVIPRPGTHHQLLTLRDEANPQGPDLQLLVSNKDVARLPQTRALLRLRRAN